MTLLEAINVRKSVRTYDSHTPIEADALAKLQNYISTPPLPWPGNCGVRIRMCYSPQATKQRLGTYGFISGATNYLVLTVRNSEDRTLMAAGYAMEHAILYATTLGLATCWLGGTLRRDQFGEATAINADETIVAVSPVGYAAKPRWRDGLVRTVAGSDRRKPFAQLFFTSALTPYPEDGVWAPVFNAVRVAPSASNSQPWRLVAEDDGSVSFYAGASDKHFLLNDMGIAMAHFAIANTRKSTWCRLDHPDKAPRGVEYIISMKP